MERSWNPLHENTEYADGKHVAGRSFVQGPTQQVTGTVLRSASLCSQSVGPRNKRSRPVASSSVMVHIRGRRAATTSFVELSRPVAQAQPVFVPHDVASSVSSRPEPALSVSSLGSGRDASCVHPTRSFSPARQHGCVSKHDLDLQSLSRSLGPHIIPHTSIVVDHLSMPPHLTEHVVQTHNLTRDASARTQELSPDSASSVSRRQHGHRLSHLPPAPPALRLVTHAHTDHLSGIRAKATVGPLTHRPTHHDKHTGRSMPVLATPVTAALLAGQPFPSPPHATTAALPTLFTYACGGARVTRYHPVLPGYGCCSWPSQDTTGTVATGCKWVAACAVACEGDAGACIDTDPPQALAPVEAVEDSDDDVVVVSHTLPPLRTLSVGAANAAPTHNPLARNHRFAAHLPGTVDTHNRALTPAPSLTLRDNPALRVSCLQPVPLDTLRAVVAAAETPHSGPCGMQVDLDWDMFGSNDASHSCGNQHLPAADRAHSGVSAADTRHTPMSLPHFPTCSPLPTCAWHAISVSPLHALLYLNCLPAPASESCSNTLLKPHSRRSPQLHETLLPHPAQYGCTGACEQPSLATSTPTPSCHSCHPHVLVAVLPANHCPGSALFVLRTRTRTVLHTGDLRYSAALHRLLLRVLGPVDAVYMDATFTHCHVLLPPPAQGLAQLRSCVRAFVHARMGAVAQFLLVANTDCGVGELLVDPVVPRRLDTAPHGASTHAAATQATSHLHRSLPQLYLLLAHQWALRALPSCFANNNTPVATVTTPVPFTDTTAPSDPTPITLTDDNTPPPSSLTTTASSLYAPSASLLSPLDCVVGVGALGHAVLFALHDELHALRTAMHAGASRLLSEYARMHGGIGITTGAFPLSSTAYLLLDYKQALLVHQLREQGIIDAHACGSVPTDAAVCWSSPAALPRALHPVLQPLLSQSHTTAARRIYTCLHTLTALSDAHTVHASEAGCVRPLGRRTKDSVTDPFAFLEDPPCPPRRVFSLAHKPECETAALASALPPSTPLAAQPLSAAHSPVSLLATSSPSTTLSAAMDDTPNTPALAPLSATSASVNTLPYSLGPLLARLSLPGVLPLAHAPLFLSLLFLLSPPRALLAPMQGLHALVERGRSALQHALGTALHGGERVGAQVLSTLRTHARESGCSCRGQYLDDYGRAPPTDDSDDDCCVIVEDTDEPVLLSTHCKGSGGVQGLLHWWARSHARYFPSLFQHYWGALPLVPAAPLTATRPPCRCECECVVVPTTAPSAAAMDALFYVHCNNSRQPDHVFNRLLLLLLWLEAEAEVEMELALGRRSLLTPVTRPSSNVPPTLVLKPSAMFFAQRMARRDYSIYTHPPTSTQTPFGISLPRGARSRVPALHEYLEELRRTTQAAEETCFSRGDVATAVVEDELGVTHVCVTMHSDYSGALHLLADTQPRTVLAVCDGFPEADDLRTDADA